MPPSSLRKRRVGHRNGHDAVRTRADILAAATKEFSRHGLTGARVDRIARAAGANKRMLYYYFGNKRSLFQAVLEAAYRSIRDAEKRLDLLSVDSRESIRRLVAFTWEYFLSHPEFIRLLNSENLHRASHLRGSRSVRTLNSPIIETLRKVLVRGCREGVFRGGVDALQLYISIAALGYFYLSNNMTLSAVFGRNLSAARAREERLAHMTEVVLGYLSPPVRQTK